MREATVFPHNIGLGACNDPDLIERVARTTAREVLATGVEWTFAPTLAVARDDHWGRTYESYSEDPELVSAYAPEFVRGMQGDLGRDSIVTCVKHFVGDGGTRGGVDQGDLICEEDELRRLHLAPYLPALEAGALTVMVSLSSWNGEKCHGHRYLLTDLLKGELGFKGFVVSDWNGIDQLSEDLAEAATISANAGIDMFMVPEKWKDFIGVLRAKVEEGVVPLERVDDAVRRILTVKHMVGLFEKPRPAERYWSNHESFGSPEHREIAREAVRKSLVLLKNENGALPLNRDLRILVAGKNADNRGHQCGGFTLEWQGKSDNESIEGGTSIWEGIQRVAPNAQLSLDGSAAAASEFDVAVVAIGEKPYAEGMGDLRIEGGPVQPGSAPAEFLVGPMEPYGENLELASLHPEDLETIRAIKAQGIPVVAILVSGRPLIVNQEMELVDAFVAAWLPGSEGQGVADVLFGDYDFQGRLPFSWPKEEMDNPNRGDEPDRSLFPYGFGLTMTG